jgi:hypothetical protein
MRKSAIKKVRERFIVVTYQGTTSFMHSIDVLDNKTKEVLYFITIGEAIDEMEKRLNKSWFFNPFNRRIRRHKRRKAAEYYKVKQQKSLNRQN